VGGKRPDYIGRVGSFNILSLSYMEEVIGPTTVGLPRGLNETMQSALPSDRHIIHFLRIFSLRCSIFYFSKARENLFFFPSWNPPNCTKRKKKKKTEKLLKKKKKERKKKNSTVN